MSHREDLKLTPRFSKAIFSPLTTFQLAHSVTVAVFERLGGRGGRAKGGGGGGF